MAANLANLANLAKLSRSWFAWFARPGLTPCDNDELKAEKKDVAFAPHC